MKGVDNKEKPRYEVKKRRWEVDGSSASVLQLLKKFQFTFMMPAISLNDHIDTMAVMKPMTSF